MRAVSNVQALKHYTKFADINLDGSYYYRFASHQTFAFWMMNMNRRHALLNQTSIYTNQNTEVKNLPFEELQKMVREGKADKFMHGLHRYAANLPGTEGFWYKQTTELQALVTNLGCPTLFFTLSMADRHWPDLLRHLPWPPGTDILKTTPQQRAKLIKHNSHICSWYFKERLDCFRTHMLNILDADYHWDRIESQKRRGMLHCHGTIKMKNNHQLVENSRIALIGYLANKKLTDQNQRELAQNDTRPWMQPKDYLFSAEEHKNSDNTSRPLQKELEIAFEKDIALYKGSLYRWYIGVSAESDHSHNVQVLSGKRECFTATQRSILSCFVVHKINNLHACLAWTLESRLIKALQERSHTSIVNKSSAFGLGELPQNWSKSTKYTITLVRGTRSNSKYRAYGDLPNEIQALEKLVAEGKLAAQKVTKFVDFLISTCNPVNRAEKQWVRPKTHPSAETVERRKQIGEQNDHNNLVNTLQRPHKRTACGNEKVMVSWSVVLNFRKSALQKLHFISNRTVAIPMETPTTKLLLKPSEMMNGSIILLAVFWILGVLTWISKLSLTLLFALSTSLSTLPKPKFLQQIPLRLFLRYSLKQTTLLLLLCKS
jgi:hypothetical protein